MTSEHLKRARVGWSVLEDYVSKHDKGLDLAEDGEILNAATDIVADILHAVRFYASDVNTDDVTRIAHDHLNYEV